MTPSAYFGLRRHQALKETTARVNYCQRHTHMCLCSFNYDKTSRQHILHIKDDLEEHIESLFSQRRLHVRCFSVRKRKYVTAHHVMHVQLLNVFVLRFSVLL